jgi:hypothetical protein
MLRGAVISECPTLLFWHQTPMLLATLLLASLRLPPLPWHTPSSTQPHAAPPSGSLQTCPLVSLLCRLLSPPSPAARRHPAELHPGAPNRGLRRTRQEEGSRQARRQRQEEGDLIDGWCLHSLLVYSSSACAAAVHAQLLLEAVLPSLALKTAPPPNLSLRGTERMYHIVCIVYCVRGILRTAQKRLCQRRGSPSPLRGGTKARVESEGGELKIQGGHGGKGGQRARQCCCCCCCLAASAARPGLHAAAGYAAAGW